MSNSAPEKWPLPSTNPSGSIYIATIYADKVEQLEQIQQRALDRNALTLLGTREGCTFPGEKERDFVHFGYRDNISQPRFEGCPTRSAIPTDNPRRRSAPCCWGIRPSGRLDLTCSPTRRVRARRHLQRLSRAEAGCGGLREVSRSGCILSAPASAKSRSCYRPATEKLARACHVVRLSRGRRDGQPVRPLARWYATGTVCGRYLTQNGFDGF